jgi:hypothetical protein
MHGFRGGPSTAVLAELRDLRADVAELSERVAFTERLLANPRSPDPTRSPGASDRDAAAR